MFTSKTTMQTDTKTMHVHNIFKYCTYGN